MDGPLKPLIIYAVSTVFRVTCLESKLLDSICSIAVCDDCILCPLEIIRDLFHETCGLVLQWGSGFCNDEKYFMSELTGFCVDVVALRWATLAAASF